MVTEMGENVFRILEIEPTNDKKEIKKAYAGLVKRYHPEEFPEEWKKIHDAYELAMKMAEHVQPKMSPEPPVKIEVLEPQVQEREPEAEPSEPTDEKEAERPPVVSKQSEFSNKEGQPKRKPLVLERKIATESSEPIDEEEMESLFDNIGKMSREQLNQKKEERKKAVEEAVATLRQMAAKKRLNQKAWENFFGREDMQSIICTGEFLYDLGECFINKKINNKMYHFLMEELDRIEQYRKDRNITEDSAGVSDPLGYARGKIRSACKTQRRVHDLVDGTRTLVKAATWLLVVLLSVSGTYLRISRHTGGAAQQRQRQYEQSVERNRELIESMEERDKKLIESIEEQQNKIQDKIKEELSQKIELVEAGDTRERMISLYGEPDSSQVDPKNPDYETAVYHLYDVDMTIMLYMDEILSVYYEIKIYQEENGGE